MFKSHLDMIGRNEPVSKKAKFWQSYVRSLKGSEDIRADDHMYNRRSLFPELTTSWPYNKSIFDDPIHAADRINIPGYRYLPIHRETYGYSPRPIYAHNYPTSLERYRPMYHVPRRYDPYVAQKALQNHLDRMAAIDRLYPSRYGLYLKDRASPLPMASDLRGVEYEPDNKPHFGGRPSRSRSPMKDIFDEADKWLNLDRRMRERSPSPTPVKPGEFAPRDTEVAFDRDGLPIFSRGGLKNKPWSSMLDPSPYMPMSSITKDPFWWNFPELKPFRPYTSWGKSPFYIRDSYLSPVKRTYLWDKHPVRPLAAVH